MVHKKEKSDKDDPVAGANPGKVITPELCAAYREALSTQILDLKNDFKRMEGRQWMAISGIAITILLTILGLTIR